MSEFMPHGETCKADKGMPDCVVRCGNRATAYVHEQGRAWPVCDQHLRWWLRDHPEDARAKGTVSHV